MIQLPAVFLLLFDCSHVCTALGASPAKLTKPPLFQELSLPFLAEPQRVQFSNPADINLLPKKYMTKTFGFIGQTHVQTRGWMAEIQL